MHTTLPVSTPFQQAVPGSVSGQELLEFQRSRFQAEFNRKPFLFHHLLSGHPLFELPRLVKLATELPETFVEYNAGNLPVSIEWKKTPKNGLSAEETIRRIEECSSWMVLKRVDQDPEYRELLDLCLDQIQRLSEPLDAGMYDRAAAVFVSSPNAVTPYHLDHEYNFLAQIRGLKTLHVFDPRDRTLLSEDELERYFGGGRRDRNLVFRDEYQQKAYTFTMQPGTGVHVPSCAPHWVKNGNNVSISFSIGFYTSVSRRQGNVYLVNSKLRKLGIRPTPYGRSPLRDSLKAMMSMAGRSPVLLNNYLERRFSRRAT